MTRTYLQSMEHKINAIQQIEVHLGSIAHALWLGKLRPVHLKRSFSGLCRAGRELLK